MESNTLDMLYKIFELALIPLLCATAAAIIALLNAKKQELIESTENELAKKYLEMLDKTITDCVLATNQTYVEALKKQGSFDMEAQKEAFQQSYNAVFALLSDEAKEYLNEAIKDLGYYVTTKIESQVALAKK